MDIAHTTKDRHKIKYVKMIAKKTIDSVQFLRFVAATLVVLYHATESVNWLLSGNILQVLLDTARFGASGVHLFFVISGFIMVYTSFPGGKLGISSREFLIRRFIRIFPIYWVYAGFFIVFNMLQNDHHLTFTQTTASLLLVPGYAHLIMVPAWTLPYEVYFYLCFGLIVIGMQLRNGMVAISLLFMICVAIGLAIKPEAALLFLMTNPILIEFLLGAWIGYMAVSGNRIRLFLADVMTGFGIACFVGWTIFSLVVKPAIHVPFILTWGVPSALVVAGLVFREIEGKNFNVVDKFCWLGDSSYSLYLIHIPLFAVVLKLIAAFDGASAIPSGQSAAIASSFMLTAICIAASIVAYNLFERPLTTFLRRKLSAR